MAPDLTSPRLPHPAAPARPAAEGGSSTGQEPLPALTGPLLERLAELGGGSLHFGWWDEPGQPGTPADAMDRTTDQVIARLGVGPRATVLVLGCGTGGPALRISRATGAEVLGVVSDSGRVKLAERRTADAGLCGRVQFEVADPCALGYAAAAFDAVVCLDSLGRMDRARVLPELRRVLRPGGRLVVHDCVLHASAGEAQRAVAGVFRRLALLGPYPRPGRLAALVEDAGLDVLELADVTERTAVPSFAALHRIFEELAPRLTEEYGAEAVGHYRRFFAEGAVHGAPHRFVRLTARCPAG